MSKSKIVENNDRVLDVEDDRARFHKSYRNWTIGVATIGMLYLSSYVLGMDSALSTAFSFLLVAALMYFFRVTSMFLVIVVLLAWTAISNLLTVLFNNETLLTFDFFLFAFFAITAFRQYRKFKPYDDEIANDPTGVTEDHQSRLALARRLFPVGGLVIALVSMGNTIFVWLLTAFIAIVDPSINTSADERFIYGITMSATFIAFAISLASYFSGYPRRRMAALGMISAAIAYLIQLGLHSVKV